MKRNSFIGLVFLAVIAWVALAGPTFAAEPVVTWKGNPSVTWYGFR